MLESIKRENMIKHLYILAIALTIIGCQNKSKTVQIPANIETPVFLIKEAKVDVPKEVKSIKAKATKRATLPKDFVEKKKLKRIGVNIPSTCKEWSDGCNTCSRKSTSQAYCTLYTCNNRAPFSCLKWQ